MSEARFPMVCGFCGKPGVTYCNAACKQAWCAADMLSPKYARVDFTAIVDKALHRMRVNLP